MEMSALYHCDITLEPPLGETRHLCVSGPPKHSIAVFHISSIAQNTALLRFIPARSPETQQTAVSQHQAGPITIIVS